MCFGAPDAMYSALFFQQELFQSPLLEWVLTSASRIAKKLKTVGFTYNRYTVILVDERAIDVMIKNAGERGFRSLEPI